MAPPVALAAPVQAPPAKPAIPIERVAALLFPDGAPEGCEDRARCLVERRYAGHPQEQRDALALYDELGDVAGVEVAQDFDGGFRGIVHLVPELPIGRYAPHLAWVLAAQRDIEAFVVAATARATSPVRYRHAAIGWRFTRSVGRATPSAYAADWEVGYNVSGSLFRSAEAVRATLFHELFHLNDQDHDDWSRRALGPIVDAIDAGCPSADPATRTACLAPYAPTPLRVRGGSYYAFQHDNGDIAHEYAAELATRYFDEQRAAAAGEDAPYGTWFVCGPPQNRQAISALATEFFGGADATPACPF